MDLNEKRKIEDDLLSFVELLEYEPDGYEPDDNDIFLLGSAGMASQQYFSDYDLYTTIDDFDLKKIENILKKTEDNPDMYLIEIKFQKGNRKIKFRTLEELKKREIEKIKWDFVKIDYIVYTDFRLIELSIIYDMNTPEDDLEKKLKKDIKEYKKEGMYYKALKREFSLLNYRYKQNKDDKKLEKRLLQLSKFFNSQFGKLYILYSNLDAIVLLKENYDDKDAKKRIEIKLKDIGIKDQDIYKMKAILKKQFNDEAKRYF